MTKYQIHIDAKLLGELDFPSDNIGSRDRDTISFFVMDKLPCDKFKYLVAPFRLGSGKWAFVAWVVVKGAGISVKGELRVVENK